MTAVVRATLVYVSDKEALPDSEERRRKMEKALAEDTKADTVRVDFVKCFDTEKEKPPSA